jgi:threonine dehydrogenase-like Zn-dependent dehydrogenase
MTSNTLPSTQTALVQSEYAEALELKTIPVPEVIPGSAIIKISAAPVISYSKHVYNGTRKYPYPTPLTPGTSGVGRVVALGPDSTLLKLEQLVLIDCVIRGRDNPKDIFLMGLHDGFSAGSKKLMRDIWRNGTWAEYCRVPLECVFPLNETCLIKELGYTETDLATIGSFLVVYGGLKDVGVTAGETVVVAPATGGFGGAAVKVALAMGASVIAMGRSEKSLNGLVSTFGERVKTVKITGDTEKDAEELKNASRENIDVVFDISPPMAAKSTHIKSCISAIRHGGRISLMGGFLEDIPIPLGLVMHKNLTMKGKWMYGRDGIQGVIKMVEAGILKIGEQAGMRKAGGFEFKDWEQAFDMADAYSGWDSFVMMKPPGK